MHETLSQILTARFKVKPESISPDASLKKLGLDSLFLVELSIIVEGEIGVPLEFDDLTEADTIAEVVEVMERKAIA